MPTNAFSVTELPIIQAPMAGVQDSALTIAVSNAGGLGSLPCAMLDAETLRAELKTIKSQTSKPFNLNFFCHTPPEPDFEREAKWRKILQSYFKEYDLNYNDIPTGSGRRPFNQEAADLLAEYKPPVISFHFGLPEAKLLAQVKKQCAIVLASATNLEEAKWLEKNGADGIIAQGIEAGGHRGIFLSNDLSTQVKTFELLRQIIGTTKLPVIAAGGISTAKEVAEAISMGASAVQLGTAYLLCTETKTSKIQRTALKSNAARKTVITNIFSGRPARGIINRSISEIGPINPDTPEFPLAAAAISALRTKAEATGSDDFTPLWCGQNIKGCSEISAADLTRKLASKL
ncbi:MAG: nitronate monooxygenase [SAR324 cluster bacterium]|nr:nitronate monooxygenase [SAR324 cluster bacterium]